MPPVSSNRSAPSDGELEHARDLRASDFAERAAEEPPVDRGDGEVVSLHACATDDDAVVALRHDALHRKIRRSRTLERREYFAKRRVVDDTRDPFARG